MKRDWMDGYVTKVAGKSYEISKVQEVFEKLINRLNVKLEDKGQPAIKFDKEKNEIILTDCIISFKENGHVLKLSKRNTDNRALMGELSVFDNLTQYTLKSTGGHDIGSSEDIDEAIAYALRHALLELR
ncbi:hypothetical protein [Sporosarcina psychrophila]|uniref:Phage protein n=1 Tax=Sporosarcina psychrophila TaxID=1476 RepID=A0ABV2KF37_SPOPS